MFESEQRRSGVGMDMARGGGRLGNNRTRGGTTSIHLQVRKGWWHQIPPPLGIVEAATYNGAGCDYKIWEHAPPSSSRKETTGSSTGSDGEFFANFPTCRRREDRPLYVPLTAGGLIRPVIDTDDVNPLAARDIGQACIVIKIRRKRSIFGEVFDGHS